MQIFKTQRDVDQDTSTDWRNESAFSSVYEYWRSKRTGHELPLTTDIDLLALIPWLPHLTLFDLLSYDEAICRFVGTAITERMGRDLTGQNVFPQQSIAMRKRTQKAYQTIINHPCGMVSCYTNHYSNGIHGMVRSLHLPLAAVQGTPPRLLGVVVREEKADYLSPIEQTISVTDVTSVEWVDIGLGVPSEKA